MPENKTKPTAVTPESVIHSLKDDARKSDALTLLELAASATGSAPVMWGPSIIGFGEHEYVHASGRSGTMPAIGFALRGKKIAMYGLHEVAEEHPEILRQLGPHTMGKGCLYRGSFDQINQRMLKSLLTKAFKSRASTKGARN